MSALGKTLFNRYELCALFATALVKQEEMSQVQGFFFSNFYPLVLACPKGLFHETSLPIISKNKCKNEIQANNRQI